MQKDRSPRPPVEAVIFLFAQMFLGSKGNQIFDSNTEE